MKYQYCAKNELSKYESHTDNLFCGGSNGDGVDEDCSECYNYCVTPNELASRIGFVVMGRVGIPI